MVVRGKIKILKLQTSFSVAGDCRGSNRRGCSSSRCLPLCFQKQLSSLIPLILQPSNHSTRGIMLYHPMKGVTMFSVLWSGIYTNTFNLAHTYNCNWRMSAERYTKIKQWGRVSLRLQGLMNYFDKYQPDMNKFRSVLYVFLAKTHSWSTQKTLIVKVSKPDREHDSVLGVQCAAAAPGHSWTRQRHPTPASQEHTWSVQRSTNLVKW
jgi:hypothetical protein